MSAAAEPRLFSCGRNVHGELGIGKPKKPKETKRKTSSDPPPAPAPSSSAGEADPVGGWEESNQLDDELFGMLGSDGHSTQPPPAAAAQPKPKPKPKPQPQLSLETPAIDQGKGFVCLPTEIKGLPKGIVLVKSGHYHTSVIGAKNTMFTWGADISGQCGHGRAQNQWDPKWVMAVTGKNVSDVACGRTHTLIVAGGHVYSWGASSYGALGISQSNFDQLNPTQVRLLRRTAIKQVAAGCDHSLALSNGGDVYAWGRVENGRLGLGSHPKSATFDYVPRRMTGFAGKVASLCAGHSHTLAIMESGELFVWGSNESGQLGTGDLAPRYSPYGLKIPKPHSTFEKMAVVEAAAGARHSAAVVMWFNVMKGEMRTQVFTWGSNRRGQLGLSAGSEEAKTTRKPTTVPFFDEFTMNEDAKIQRATAVAAGGHHTLVLAQGVPYSFGCNSYGQLGLGDRRDRQTPTPVKALQKHHIELICCGAWHSIFLTGEAPIEHNTWVPFAEPPEEIKDQTAAQSSGKKHPPRQHASSKVPVVPRQPKKQPGILSALFSGNLGGIAMCTGARKSTKRGYKPPPPAGRPPGRS